MDEVSVARGSIVAELTGPGAPGSLARLRTTAPVVRVAELGAWLVLTRAAALAVMRDPETYTVDDARFSTGRVVGASMLTLDGSEHDRHRAPFAAPFRPRAVRARFAAWLEAEAARRLDALAPAGRADLRAAFAGPLAAATMGRALGLDAMPPETLLGWYRAIVGSVDALSAGGGPTRAGDEAVRELRGALAPVLGGDPAGSPLAAAAHHSGLREDEVMANAAVLLFGGIETTEGMILNALAHLLAAPAALARVRAAPRLVAEALEESLRLEPAAAAVDRYATRDAVLAGVRVRAGDLVRVSLTGANTDPAHVADPLEFRLERPAAERRHLAFAQGPHVCLGVHLARLEGRIAVAAALARLPGLRLDPEAPPAPPAGLVFRKPPALRVCWDQPAGASGRSSSA